jgi:hypothetical protein
MWTLGCPSPVQLTTSTPTYGQMQLTCPSHGPPFAVVPLCHASILALPPRRAVTSFPLSWRSPRCFYAMHGYKRRSPSASHPHQCSKPSLPNSPLFSTTSSVQSHLTPPLSSYACPRAINHTGELRLSVVRPPRFDSAPGTVSGRCAEVHGCFPWTSSHGPSSCRPSLTAPRHALAPRAAHRVDFDAVCPRPLLQATPC